MAEAVPAPPAEALLTEGVVDMLGGRETLEDVPRSAEELRGQLIQGLPYAALESVMEKLGISRVQACEILQMSTRTLTRRRKANLRLHSDESDRLYRMARVAVRAGEVFGTTDKASRWLRRPNRALGGHVPLSLLSTDLGVRQVEQALGRIEHGVFA